MGFKEDVALDIEAMFDVNELAVLGTIRPADLLPREAPILRTGLSQLVVADPGLGDMDTFRVLKKHYPQPTPGDKITISGVEYIVQVGFSFNDLEQAWSIPVIGNGRVKA